MKEQTIQHNIIKFLESKGHYVVKVIQASKAGVPDLLACINGRFVGLEVKKPDKVKNTSKLQVYNLEKIKESGGRGYIVSSVKEVEDILKESDNG